MWCDFQIFFVCLKEETRIIFTNLNFYKLVLNNIIAGNERGYGSNTLNAFVPFHVPELLSGTFSDKPVRDLRRLTRHRGSAGSRNRAKGWKSLVPPRWAMLTGGTESCMSVLSQRLWQAEGQSLQPRGTVRDAPGSGLHIAVSGVELTGTLRGGILVLIGPCSRGLIQGSRGCCFCGFGCSHHYVPDDSTVTAPTDSILWSL